MSDVVYRMKTHIKNIINLISFPIIIKKKKKLGEDIKNSDFVLPYIEMRITTRCNMKCKNCGHLIPCYGSNARDLSFEDFKKNFDNLINAVSYIKVLSLVGGETLLSENLFKIVEYVLNCDKVGEIRLVSNGKRIPSEELLKLLSNTRVCIHFSQCDQNMDNYPIIKQLCKEHNVNTFFYHDENRFWYNYGEVKNYHHMRISMIGMSYNCFFGIAKQYNNGKLFLCPRISNAYELGLIELPDSDIFEITDDVETSRRNIISFFQKSYCHGCKFCNVNKRTKIKMAEQIE